MRYNGDRGCGGEEAAKVGQLMVADEDDGGDEVMWDDDGDKGGVVRRRRRCGGEDGVEMTCGGWWPEVGQRLAGFREEMRGGG
ncbi:hypothetical protein Tco_0465626 [Tanacetum coccineum]